MPAGAAIGVGSAVAGGIGAYGSMSAAKTQAEYQQKALDLQKSMFDQTKQTLQPFVNAGNSALGQIGGLMGWNGQQPDYSSFTNSPDYQFAQQQGNLGVTRYNNALGLAQSGGALKDIATFNSGLASQQYGNYFQRLMGLATLGNNAAGSFAGANTAGAQAMGQTTGNIGTALGGGIAGATNAATGAFGNMTNYAMFKGLMGGNNSAYANAGMKGIG